MTGFFYFIKYPTEIKKYTERDFYPVVHDNIFTKANHEKQFKCHQLGKAYVYEETKQAETAGPGMNLKTLC